MLPTWTTKFELKPGKWVFVPTPEAVVRGLEIKKLIKKIWNPPEFYYHLRSGGHVAAIKSHLAHKNFLHLDIQDFFGTINRTRITRRLKPRMSYKVARRVACESVVIHPTEKNKFILPYGFVQSPHVASFCLDESVLGTYLRTLWKNKNLAVSVYVDDIIVSTNDAELCEIAMIELKQAAEKSAFTLNPKKEEGPAPAITAFNILLSENSMQLSERRIQEFIDVLAVSENSKQKSAILGYINSINPSQLEEIL